MSNMLVRTLTAIERRLPGVNYEPGEEPKAFVDGIRRQFLDGPNVDRFEAIRPELHHAVSVLAIYARMSDAKEAFTAAASIVDTASTRSFVGTIAELDSAYPGASSEFSRTKELVAAPRIAQASSPKELMQTIRSFYPGVAKGDPLPPDVMEYRATWEREWKQLATGQELMGLMNELSQGSDMVKHIAVLQQDIRITYRPGEYPEDFVARIVQQVNAYERGRGEAFPEMEAVMGLQSSARLSWSKKDLEVAAVVLGL